jgi:hypothetical protein
MTDADQLDLFASPVAEVAAGEAAPALEQPEPDDWRPIEDIERARRLAEWEPQLGPKWLAHQAERRRMPDHAEMLAHALRLALPTPYRLAYPDLTAAIIDQNNTAGGTGPGCTQYEADRRGVTFTYYAVELADPDALGAVDPTPEQVAALDAWRASHTVAARFTWSDLADRLAPTPAQVEAARTLAGARRQMIEEAFSDPAGARRGEWAAMHEADYHRLDHGPARWLAAAVIEAADTRETPGGLF